jgi:tetratricopeptide (TPR) repeat protein
MLSRNVLDEAVKLANMNHWLESNSVLAPALEDQETRLDALRLCAMNYRHLGEFQKSIEYLDQLLNLKSDDVGAALEKSTCLINTGQTLRALNILNELILKDPNNPWILAAWLKIKARSVLPATIIRELSLAKDKLATEAEFNLVLDDVRALLISLHEASTLLESDPGNILELAPRANQNDNADLSNIYKHFESLGFNCEFGFAQRKVGVEPIGLFRWSGIEPHHLMEAMDNRLEDFDCPEHYSLELKRKYSALYFLRDSYYATLSHTHVIEGTIAEDTLLKKMIQRQIFLKRKLLSEIKLGEKIFVYRFFNAPTDRYVEKLVASMQGIGMKKILIARASDENFMPGYRIHLPGSSRVFSKNVMMGYLSTNYPDTPYAEWDQIVQTTYDYFEGQKRKNA